MEITSTKVQVQAAQDVVFEFLKDTRNLIHLLPQDQISDWQATPTECSFKVQGGVVISLVLEHDVPYSTIKMRSGVKSPFPFHLSILMEDINGQTEGYLHFEGELNVFIKMMVQKPLTALFNMMSENLKLHFSKMN